MKIIFDTSTKIDTIVLENYNFTPSDTAAVQTFCNQALSEHETIGGIYWQDSKGTLHSMETTNQTLYSLLFVFYYLSRHQQVNIKYDTDAVSAGMLGFLFKRPAWFVKICQKLGIVKHTVTYTDFIRCIRERSRNQASETVSGEVRK